MKHTPAPWHMMETEPGIEAEMDVFVVTPRYAGGTSLIARVVNADDAPIIAAAPALLEALQEARFLIWHQYAEEAGPWRALLRRIDDAIAAATEA